MAKRTEIENFDTIHFIDEMLAEETAEPKDIINKWYELPHNLRLKRWKNTVDTLCTSAGLDRWAVARCIGLKAKPKTNPAFYRSLPEKDTYAKIGILFRQDRQTIDKWITKNCKSRGLYVKDLRDLIWIFLIELSQTKAWEKYNLALRENRCTIEDIFEEFHSKVLETYSKSWNQSQSEPQNTLILDTAFHDTFYTTDNDEDAFLRKFVGQYHSSFQSAFQHQREYERKYIQIMVDMINRSIESEEAKWDIDSFILETFQTRMSDYKFRYLSAPRDDWKNYLLKKKSSYISLGLSLGMTLSDINEYLSVCGFDKLHIDDKKSDELMLIYLLNEWEQKHPQQRKFKDRYLFGGQLEETPLSQEEEREALEQMLTLRDDIEELFQSTGLAFPF